ncbi:hypothetical protein N184_19945 [Sinorhizobium sp. GL28]|nr:hypothetical protein N184_19945 [Sinorhizobium sp. GL28]
MKLATISELVLGLRAAVGVREPGEKPWHRLITNAIKERLCIVLLFEPAFTLDLHLEDEL